MRLSWSSGKAMQERQLMRFTDCRPIRGAGPGATEVDESHNFREQRYHLGGGGSSPAPSWTPRLYDHRLRVM